MQVGFESSHVAGDFAAGWLTVGITRDADGGQASITDAITFSVPADFHVHNDAVAAALMPLVETRGRDVRFNFGISAASAGILRDYYQPRDIGPVDPALPPRTLGRRL